MNPWILVGALLVVGPLAAAIITLVVGFAGAPGAILDAVLARRNGRSPSAVALVVTICGQLLVSLVWMAVVYQSTENLLAGAEGLGRYVARAAAFLTAVAPMKYAARDSSLEAKRTVQHHAAPLVFNLAAWIAVFFLFFPSLLQTSFGWVPHWGKASANQADVGVPGHLAEDLEELTAVFSHFSTANRLSVELGKENAVDPDKERQMYDHIEAGLRASGRVGDQLLDWLHPGMRVAFRDHLIRGHIELLEGMRASDLARQVRGNELVGEWYRDFWELHQDEILSKAFGPP